MLQSKSRLLMFVLYGTMFFFGILENIKGVSYPLIKNEFDVSYETQGKMISILSISYTIFVFVTGFMLGRRFRIKKLHFFGLTCVLLAASLVYFMPDFWTVTSSLFILFAGFGVIEIAMNNVATKIFTTKAALMLNLLHFMYGAGAIVGPKAAGMLAEAGLLWRQIYLVTIPLTLIIFIPSIFTRFPEGNLVPEQTVGSETRPEMPDSTRGENNNNSQESQNLPSGSGFITALKTPAVWVFGITLGFMVGLEMASSNWGGLYFQDMYGMDPVTSGANFVSAFYALFTLSRLVSGFLIEKIGYMRSLIGSTFLIMVIFVAGFALGAPGIYVLPLLGFFLAIFWPTFIAVSIGRFGSNAPVMTSAIIAIAGLLNSGIQLVMGYINRWIGTGWGYRSCLVFALILICLLCGINRQLKKTSQLQS